MTMAMIITMRGCDGECKSGSHCDCDCDCDGERDEDDLVMAMSAIRYDSGLMVN